jgi:uncharacterized membrane protein YraQ (UPF0718 family)
MKAGGTGELNMGRNNMEKMKTPVSRGSLISLLAVVLFAVMLLAVFPGQRERVLDTSWRFFLEMIMILPAIVVLTGFFSIFVSKEFISKYLGHASGVRGFILSVLLGALPSGPLYVAFPIAATLREKGASTSNMLAFLTAWACIKLPQEMVELRFMGLKFTLLRLGMTIAASWLMGMITERVVDSGNTA